MFEIKQLDDKINFPVNKYDKMTLQILASRRQITMSDLVRIALRYYIDNTCPVEYTQVYDNLLAKETP